MSKIDTTLIDTLKILAKKEKIAKIFKRRMRTKGKVVGKTITKNGNITLKIEKDGESFSYTVIKSHKERFALAEKLQTGEMVAAEGIPKFRIIICTRLKILDNAKEGKQEKLDLSTKALGGI